MASPKQRTFTLSRFKRVRVTPDPFDDRGPDTLATTVNAYLADPIGGGGLYQRPGRVRWDSITNGGNPGQGVYCHRALDGTSYNFFFVNGRVWRQATDLTSAPVDVTPVGVTIATGKFVYATSLNDSMVVNDGVNEPWIGTDLGSTPIVGTYIDYDGAGGAWSAFGPPVVYTGAIFFILNTVGSASARTTIAWSEPNQPGVGYQQTGYDNAWTLTQTSSEPLYTLVPTNDALYYSRALSWGAITGAPNINFQNTATHDVVSANIGCTAPATIGQFLNYVYFCDAAGRPYRFAIGGAPEPIWLQAQGSFDPSGDVSVGLVGGWGVIEPNLNVYLYGLATATGGAASTHVFDAATGIYMGQWANTSSPFDIGGLLRDANGNPHLAMLQQNVGGIAYCWRMARPWDNIWTDNGVPVIVAFNTGYLGYGLSEDYTFSRARLVMGTSAGSTTPVIGLTLATTQSSQLVGNGYTPGATAEGQWRLTWMIDRAMGRGASLRFSGSTWSNQLRVFGIELDAVPSSGGIDDR